MATRLNRINAPATGLDIQLMPKVVQDNNFTQFVQQTGDSVTNGNVVGMNLTGTGVFSSSAFSATTTSVTFPSTGVWGINLNITIPFTSSSGTTFGAATDMCAVQIRNQSSGYVYAYQNMYLTNTSASTTRYMNVSCDFPVTSTTFPLQIIFQNPTGAPATNVKVSGNITKRMS